MADQDDRTGRALREERRDVRGVSRYPVEEVGRSEDGEAPTLVMHGDDDQIVPYADTGPLSARLVQNGTLKTYKGFPHGMPTTQAQTINADLLAFV